MKYFSLTTIACLLFFSVAGQKPAYISAAVLTTQNAMPFGKFTGLFSEIIHPGIEVGYGKIIQSKSKHDWLMELKLAYFYHRFVQHGIPLYLKGGYRYKVNSRLSAETMLGAGYLHSIPAVAKLKLDENGEYSNNKGVGRMQAMAAYSIGINYVLNKSAEMPLRVFMNYQQQLQMPFVKSYVPILPYNVFLIGISKPIFKNKIPT